MSLWLIHGLPSSRTVLSRLGDNREYLQSLHELQKRIARCLALRFRIPTLWPLRAEECRVFPRCASWPHPIRGGLQDPLRPFSIPGERLCHDGSCCQSQILKAWCSSIYVLPASYSIHRDSSTLEFKKHSIISYSKTVLVLRALQLLHISTQVIFEQKELVTNLPAELLM